MSRGLGDVYKRQAIRKILSSPERASKMAVNARKTVTIEATKQLADRVEEISGWPVK